MKADVPFHYLRHQTIQRPTASGHQLQNVGALLLRFESALDGFDLPSNASNPDKQLVLFARSMGHGVNIL